MKRGQTFPVRTDYFSPIILIEKSSVEKDGIYRRQFEKVSELKATSNPFLCVKW